MQPREKVGLEPCLYLRQQMCLNPPLLCYWTPEFQSWCWRSSRSGSHEGAGTGWGGLDLCHYLALLVSGHLIELISQNPHVPEQQHEGLETGLRDINRDIKSEDNRRKNPFKKIPKKDYYVKAKCWKVCCPQYFLGVLKNNIDSCFVSPAGHLELFEQEPLRFYESFFPSHSPPLSPWVVWYQHQPWHHREK